MNSSSVPASAVKPREASRAIWACRICLGEAATGSLSEDGKELFREKCFHVETFYRAAKRMLLQRQSDLAV